MSSRWRVAAIVMLFFAVPAVLTLALITSDHALEAKTGWQPGGTVRGVLVGPEQQAVSDVDVELLLEPTQHDALPEAPAVRTRTDARGAFELHAPPLDGRYRIVAGSGTWQRTARAFSFVGPARAATEPLSIELRPGCELELEFVHADGSAVRDGTYDLRGEPTGGFFPGFIRPALRQAGAVRAGKLRLEALPPLDAHLLVRFDTGERLELDLPLVLGSTRKTIRL